MTESSGAEEIVFDHVAKRYGNSPKPTIDDLSLTLPAGDICAVIGPSGRGKTTAMKLVNRLISVTEGDITIDAAITRRLFSLAGKARGARGRGRRTPRGPIQRRRREQREADDPVTRASGCRR